MFLPVEVFDPMLDCEDPFEAIDNYKDPSTGKTIGLSKWNYPNGESELRKCIIQDFNKKSNLY